jgi:hypothetical protein
MGEFSHTLSAQQTLEHCAANVRKPEGFLMQAAAQLWRPDLAACVNKPRKEEAVGILDQPMGKVC